MALTPQQPKKIEKLIQRGLKTLSIKSGILVDDVSVDRLKRSERAEEELEKKMTEKGLISKPIEKPMENTKENQQLIINNYGTIEKSNIQNTGTQNMQGDSFLEGSKQDELKTLLQGITKEVEKLYSALPDEIAKQVKLDLQILNTELSSKTPRKQWYELSADGLIKAATNVGAIGKPVLDLAAQILLLLK